MSIEKKVAWLSGSLGIITFIDQYLLTTSLLKSLSIPESIPTSIFLILTFVILLIIILSSKKELTLPYPDQRKEVEDLNIKVANTVGLEEENESLKRELSSLKKIIHGEKALREKIHGILLKGSTETEILKSELKIPANDLASNEMFQVVIGKLGIEGSVTTNCLGYYELVKTNKNLKRDC